MRCLSFLIVLLLASSAFGQAPRKRKPVIDMHVHAYLDPGEPVLGFHKMLVFQSVPHGFARPPATPLTDAASHMRETFRVMDEENVVLGIVSGPLDAVERWRAFGGSRVIASPIIGNPQEEGFSPETLRQLYASKKLGAMGELVNQYVGLSPADPRLEPFFALAEELDIPVGVHTGNGPPGIGQVLPGFRVSLGNPLLIEEVIVRHPKLRVYLMHAGWPYDREARALMFQYPNVYADLGIIDWGWGPEGRKWLYPLLKQMVDEGHGKRIMFGSDQQLWPGGIPVAIENIEQADVLTEEQKRDILCDNAARFLRLDEKICQ